MASVAVRAGKMSRSRCSQGAASASIRLDGGSQPSQVLKISVSATALTNSGNESAASEVIEMTRSTSRPANTPASTPSTMARGTQITKPTAPIKSELRMRVISTAAMSPPR